MALEQKSREPGSAPGRTATAAVERVLDVVAALVRTGPATLSQIAAAATCDRATTFRALHTLKTRGLAVQDEPRGRWRLGAAWLGIAHAADNQSALAEDAAPHLRALASQCGHTILLAVRDGQESQVIAVASVELGGSRANPVGSRAPLHAGPGRLLLAYAPAGLQRSVMATRVPRYTEATRVDWPWIAAELPRIRERGWLIATNETQEGLVTISSGVHDLTGSVVAVLSIQAPTFLMRHPRAQSLLAPLMEAAAALDKLLRLFDAPH